jgi:hypothetical protein
MPEYVEIFDGFVKGRKTRRGRPVPNAPEPVVTLVHPDSIDGFLGARSHTERLRHLRDLRDRGILIHSKNRLTQAVRGQGVSRAYVFRRRADEVPRVQRAPQPPPEQAGGKMRVVSV